MLTVLSAVAVGSGIVSLLVSVMATGGAVTDDKLANSVVWVLVVSVESIVGGDSVVLVVMGLVGL